MKRYEELTNDFYSLKQSLIELINSETDKSEIQKKLNLLFDNFTDQAVSANIDFKSICDNIPTPLYIADHEGTTIYINEAYSKMSGIKASEIIGANIHQLNEEGKYYSGGVLPTVLETGKKTEKIGRMKLTDTPVYITGFPVFDHNNKIKYVVAHDQDMKRLEKVKDQLLSLRKEMHKSDEELKYLRSLFSQEMDIVSTSHGMVKVVSLAHMVAPTDATVLITGESGTGKEIISNYIYQYSKRNGKPFLKVNCSAIPESLMESELFGYEPGSFTGAKRSGKTGIFELANNGTLMLDEIGEMPLSMQSKLLRVIQNKEIVKIGGTSSIPIDVRFIAATNRDLKKCIKEGTFREDLFYRLNVVPIEIPPLRSRTEDIEPLIQHFASRYNKKYNKNVEFTSKAVHLMEQYEWPGNIRELQNVVERLIVVNHTDIIDEKNLVMFLGNNSSNMPLTSSSLTLKEMVIEAEKNIILSAIAAHGSKRKAAAALGTDHSTFIKKCQRYNI